MAKSKTKQTSKDMHFNKQNFKYNSLPPNKSHKHTYPPPPPHTHAHTHARTPLPPPPPHTHIHTHVGAPGRTQGRCCWRAASLTTFYRDGPVFNRCFQKVHCFRQCLRTQCHWTGSRWDAEPTGLAFVSSVFNFVAIHSEKNIINTCLNTCALPSPPHTHTLAALV